MKKNRKNRNHTYEKYADKWQNVSIPTDDITYYGLHKENGRIKVDIKRLKKLNISTINPNFLDQASQIPRNTTYFLPKKIHQNDYIINQFRNKLISLQKQWFEIKNAFTNIKSPNDVYNSQKTDLISSGIYDIEEAEEKGILASVKRYPVYEKLWISQCAQFIHQMATELDALMLRKCAYLGYARKDVSRGSMHDYLNGTQKGKISVEKLKGYDTYTKFFTIWNLIKHNSEDLFDKVKSKYSEMLLVEEYHNGEMSQYYLKIGDGYIEQMLADLLVFYEDLCVNFFDEDIEQSKWNYDDYFLKNVEVEIDNIRNPLGL